MPEETPCPLPPSERRRSHGHATKERDREIVGEDGDNRPSASPALSPRSSACRQLRRDEREFSFFLLPRGRYSALAGEKDEELMKALILAPRVPCRFTVYLVLRA